VLVPEWEISIKARLRENGVTNTWPDRVVVSHNASLYDGILRTEGCGSEIQRYYRRQPAVRLTVMFAYSLP